jgi:hypothetical protein
MSGIDTTVPHEARVYDYILGGKDNYEVDRAAADQILQVVPQMRTWARQNRGFLKRAVRYVAEQGVRQFLDIGTGLPTAENTHEVAHQVDPGARVVYVDYDPLVLAHARVLLEGGNTAYVQGDLRRPEELLDAARETLDLDEPVAVMLIAILHHLSDDEDPGACVRTVLDAVPVGSYLVLTHGTYDFLDPADAERLHQVLTSSPMPFRARTRAEVEETFLAGLELVGPGMAPTTGWRVETGEVGIVPGTGGAGHWAVVARKTA